jgi:exopolysaccharide biosynthesis protein
MIIGRAPRSRVLSVAVIALFALLSSIAVAAAPVDSTPGRMIGPGVSYWTAQRPGPLSIHIIELDPKQQYISVSSTAAGTVPGRLTVSDFAFAATTDERYPVAAVNGDYFVMGGISDGALLGLNVTGGRVVSAGNGRSALVLLDNGTVRVATLSLSAWLETPGGNRVAISAVNQPRGRNDIVLYTADYGSSTKTSASGREVSLVGVKRAVELGKVYQAAVTSSTQAVGNLALSPDRVVISASGRCATALAALKIGDQVKFSVCLGPELEAKVVEAVGGGPRLVRDGRISVEWASEKFATSHALRRHPRTAAGVKPDGHVVLVVVDGRQWRSIGMTLGELAQLMLDLGCRDAVNLDGGGSTTMWVRGEIVNSPSGGNQRPVGNALLVVSTAPHGPPTRMRLSPDAITALPGYSVQITAEAQDDYYNPVDLVDAGIGWAYEGRVGSISPSGVFTAAPVTQTETGAVKIYCRGVTARVPVTVYTRPAQLRIDPQTVTAAPGRLIRFSVTPLDDAGRPISFDLASVQWSSDQAAGLIDPTGLLQVASSGTVTAALAGVEATARVVCEARTVPVEDFEKSWTCTASAYPREVTATCDRVTDPVRDGKYAARLKYDFATTEASRAAYLELKRDIGDALAVRAWVYGDGLGHWLRGRITDGQGDEYNLDFGRVDWRGWKEVSAGIPPGAQPPIRWDTIYVSEFHPDRLDVGTLVFDLLRAEVAPKATP